jgi:pilus assembly protein CpaE
LALAANEQCILLDFNSMVGSDDLLLDLAIEKSWLDLLPVSGELKEHHLNLVAATHPSGLLLLGAPRSLPPKNRHVDITRLLNALKERFTWLLLDLPVVNEHTASLPLPVIDQLLLVSTMDPPSLRSAKRLTDALPDDLLQTTGIIFNQVTPDHPLDPEAAASSLGLPLLAMLPVDHNGIGRQVNFGMPCVGDPQSQFGRAVTQLVSRLVRLGPSCQTFLPMNDAPTKWINPCKEDA